MPLAKVREQSAAEQGSVSASQPASGDMAHERAETQPMAEPSQAQRQHAFEPDAVQPSPVEDAFEARCNAVAQHYGLTKREREVFYLLACGRTLRVIKEKLVISPNTVRFHTKNIYTKLGVHSQQELIDRVEAGSSPR